MSGRPTDLDGMQKALSHFISDESYEAGLAFVPRPTDVFISPYSKCGTTWMQQIVHGLRTRGSMDFEEITDVTPWIEIARDIGVDPTADQVAQPRAFKSHLPWDRIPKGGRYIVVFRDPQDACLSLYKFFKGWFFEAGAIPFDVFARDYYLHRPDDNNYWHHTATWWEAAARDDVLAVCFEDLKADLPAQVRKVAGFLGIALDADLLGTVVHQASFDFMNAHNGQFDDHVNRRLRDPVCGLPPDGIATKVSAGKIGGAKPLMSSDTSALFAAKWRETLGARFGLPDYRALRAVVG